jgi:cyclopropane fatty-acyl-phospholipid synthase-like methyltransferase
MENKNDSYQKRVAQQIEQYTQTVNMHDLPEIFNIWFHEYLRPGMEEVFNTAKNEELFALGYLEAKALTSGERRILSIGCGDGSIEMDLAQILIDKGEQDFEIVCADLSPRLLENLGQNAQRRGLSSYLRAAEMDLNEMQVPGQFDLIMAIHSLHHIVELEKVFTYCHDHLKDHGIFATNDMIGRNGHMRWPETALIIKSIWPMLKPESKFNVQLQRFSETFEDWDCSTEGFEGIRSQDILPLLLKTFRPYKFLGVGGIIDLFVDRGYGPSYDVNNTSDVAFIRFIAELNEILLDANMIKPTMMIAYFCKDDRQEKFYRSRRAFTSVRFGDPEWTRFYPV